MRRAKASQNKLRTEREIFVLFIVLTLLFIRQKEERIKKEDLEGRGRENDNGCSPTTTLATRRTEQQTAPESTKIPEDETDTLLTTTPDTCWNISHQQEL